MTLLLPELLDVSREVPVQVTADPRRDEPPPDYGGGAARRLATVVTLANVRPQRVRWLWKDRLPAGKLVIVDGDPAVGKSTLMLDLAARGSTGSPWPDGTDCDGPWDTLIMSAEDGLADTIRPRLDAAGGDPSRVHALTEVAHVSEEEEDGDGAVRMVPPSFPRDIRVLQQTIVEWKVQLVIVDVLMAYLSGAVDSHRDQHVRGVLHQLAAMAEDTGATIVLIRHLNKSGGGHALYRGGGSIGIIGAARAAFLVACDPDDETGDRRIFAVTKSNLAAEPPALAYQLVDDSSEGCARVEWEDEPTDHRADDLLGGPRDEDQTDQDAAAAWLIGHLTEQGGKTPARDALVAARAAGYSKTTVYRARKKARVATSKDGMGGGWVWTTTIDLKEPDRRSPEGSKDSSPHDRKPSVPSAAPDPAFSPGIARGSTSGPYQQLTSTECAQCRKSTSFTLLGGLCRSCRFPEKAAS